MTTPNDRFWTRLRGRWENEPAAQHPAVYREAIIDLTNRIRDAWGLLHTDPDSARRALVPLIRPDDAGILDVMVRARAYGPTGLERVLEAAMHRLRPIAIECMETVDDAVLGDLLGSWGLQDPLGTLSDRQVDGLESAAQTLMDRCVQNAIADGDLPRRCAMLTALRRVVPYPAGFTDTLLEVARTSGWLGEDADLNAGSGADRWEADRSEWSDEVGVGWDRPEAGEPHDGEPPPGVLGRGDDAAAEDEAVEWVDMTPQFSVVELLVAEPTLGPDDVADLVPWVATFGGMDLVSALFAHPQATDPVRNALIDRLPASVRLARLAERDGVWDDPVLSDEIVRRIEGVDHPEERATYRWWLLKTAPRERWRALFQRQIEDSPEIALDSLVASPVDRSDLVTDAHIDQLARVLVWPPIADLRETASRRAVEAIAVRAGVSLAAPAERRPRGRRDA